MGTFTYIYITYCISKPLNWLQQTTTETTTETTTTNKNQPSCCLLQSAHGQISLELNGFMVPFDFSTELCIKFVYFFIWILFFIIIVITICSLGKIIIKKKNWISWRYRWYRGERRGGTRQSNCLTILICKYVSIVICYTSLNIILESVVRGMRERRDLVFLVKKVKGLFLAVAVVAVGGRVYVAEGFKRMEFCWWKISDQYLVYFIWYFLRLSTLFLQVLASFNQF